MRLPNSLMPQTAQSASIRNILFSRRCSAARLFHFESAALAGYCLVMNSMSQRVVLTMYRLVLLGSVWLVLTGADTKGLAMGAVAVPVATWLSLRLMPARRPIHLWHLVLHLPSFVAGSVLGGFDVARRALAPNMPLKMGWVEAPARLGDGGRVLMGGALSLMPGTLAAGMRRDRLLVHLLDTGAGSERAISREEAAIARMMHETAPAERSQ